MGRDGTVPSVYLFSDSYMSVRLGVRCHVRSLGGQNVWSLGLGGHEELMGAGSDGAWLEAEFARRVVVIFVVQDQREFLLSRPMS